MRLGLDSTNYLGANQNTRHYEHSQGGLSERGRKPYQKDAYCRAVCKAVLWTHTTFVPTGMNNARFGLRETSVPGIYRLIGRMLFPRTFFEVSA